MTTRNEWPQAFGYLRQQGYDISLIMGFLPLFWQEGINKNLSGQNLINYAITQMNSKFPLRSNPWMQASLQLQRRYGIPITDANVLLESYHVPQSIGMAYGLRRQASEQQLANYALMKVKSFLNS